jgi:hypothetical protein
MRSAQFWRSTFLFTALLAAAVVILPPPRPRATPAPDRAVAQEAAAGEDSDDKLVDKVKKAIDEGVAYLKGKQRRGSWEIDLGRLTYEGGSSALVMLALLNAGVRPTDPVMQRGLEYLRGVNPKHTYVVGLQTMVFVLAGQNADRERIARNVKWLLDARLSDGWTYVNNGGGPGRGLGADNSNTQYALLGLHEAIQAGYKVRPEVLREVRKLFIDTQKPDGAWGYRPRDGQRRMTMTTAGVCNLIITGMDLAIGKAKLRKDGSAENCGVYLENGSVAKALNWIGDQFPARLTRDNARERLEHAFYCLYGIERTGRLTGQRYLGGHDWYEVGCHFLVETQKADGSWQNAGDPLDSWPLISTSFALLFLSKGRTPILVSKLAYGPADSTGWNNKRNDVRHLVEFASRELFKGQPMAWQAFDVRGKDAPGLAARKRLAAELLASPIVFFNGHDFAPDGKEKDILREYLANGGFVLAEACCGKDRFDRNFRALMKELFPDSALKPLPPEHPVWLASGKFAMSPRDFPLEGISQGCKTVVMYSPVPIAGYWEGNLIKTGRGQKAFRMGANIIAYATGLEPPRPRLTRVAVVGDDPKRDRVRGYLKVAQLRHEGDWQPAPNAMRNLMGSARKAGLDVVLETAEVYPTRENVIDYPFLYMHGRNTFSEKKEDLKHLRFWLKSGGTLFADACCGSKAFDAAFRKFVVALFGDDKLKLEPIPLKDELYSAELNGKAITTIRCRVEAAGGKRELRDIPPALEGVKYKGRWVLIYSRYDIGCALERHSSPECLGHDHDSAVRLGRAAVLYALKR